MSKKCKFLRFLAGIAGFVVIGVCSFSCTSIPEGLSPVENFDFQAYLGTWYEIARFDFKFERGLSKVTANYSLNPDGSIKVLNRGFNQEKGKWQEAKGKAKFRGADNVGALKVSFFGPFYTGYNVLKIDEDYSCALVGGKDYNYLWILARTPEISEELKVEYLAYAESLGYDTSRLLWVSHDDAAL